MIIFADCVPDDFEYPEELDNIIVWCSRSEDIDNPYRVSEYQCKLAEEKKDFVQSIWDSVCTEYGIATAGMTNEVERQVEEIDDFINSCYKSVKAFGNEYSAAMAMFFLEPQMYNSMANLWVGDQVSDILEEFIRVGEWQHNGRIWHISKETVDERCKEYQI